MKRAATEDIAPAAKAARLDHCAEFLDLCDDAITLIASFLVRPAHYAALLFTSSRMADLLTRPVIRLTMEVRYFEPWSRVMDDPSEFVHVPVKTPELCVLAVRRSYQDYKLNRGMKDMQQIFRMNDYLEDKQTREVCLAAVMECGWALEYVKERTPEICLAAVTEDGLALQWVQEQTPELCRVAVHTTGHALQYVKEQTPELCLAAVVQNGCTLKHVKEQTPELCLAAVTRNGLALHYVQEQTPELCIAAVTQTGLALEYVKEQTLEICLAAVKQNRKACRFVKIV